MPNLLHHPGFTKETSLEHKYVLRSWLFWDVMQRRLVVIYRRCGTTYRLHLLRVQQPKKNVGLLFWVVTHRRMVAGYRHFGTTCRSHLHG